MIDREGRLHVLDFGLAKLQDPQVWGDNTQAPTVPHGTEEGKILGTVAYMSPEQAVGKPVDLRSDIFSLGTILYEMVTGTRPFQGDTSFSTIGSILKDEPDSVMKLNPSLPRHMSRIICRCLAKAPDRRYQTAVDLRNDLEGFKEEIDSGEITLERTGARPGGIRFKKRRLAIGLAVLALIAIGVSYGLTILLPHNADDPDTTATSQQIEMTRLTHTGNAGYSAAISPDGKYVVNVQDDDGGSGLWLLQVSTARSVQIVPTTDVSLYDPTFSPDGDLVYYVRKARGADFGSLYRVPVLGGPSTRILEDLAGRISFSPDGSQFVFLRTEGAQKNMLVVADLDGGNERVIASRTRPEEYHRDPVWSPDGMVVAVAATRFGHREFHLVGVPSTGGAERMISSEVWGHIEDLAWLPDGSGLVMQAWGKNSSGGFQLWEVPCADGPARSITNDLNAYSGVSMTADGRSLVTQLMGSDKELWITCPGEAGEPERITSEGSSFSLAGISWAPDGRIVYGATAREGIDLWIRDMVGGKAIQLTSGGVSTYPSVSPDGRYIVFRSAAATETHIWRIDFDGGNAVQLTFGDRENRPQCHPDGRTLLYLGDASDGYALYQVPIEGGEPVQISDRTLDWRPPAISPDGEMVAVRANDESTDQWQTEILQIEGGSSLRTLDIPQWAFQWSPDGEALDYVDIENGVGNIWSQPLDGDPPRQLTHFETMWIDDFAWAPDGKTLALIRRTNTWDVVLLKHFR
jgi:Tol biopolymer transport system component